MATSAATRVAAESGSGWIRLAGWAGVASFFLGIAGLALYSAAGAPPDFADAARFTAYVRDHAALFITAVLVFGVDFTILLVFLLGVRDLIRGAGGAWSSIGDLFLISNALAIAVGQAGGALLIAATSEAATAGDVSTTRALWGGGFSLLGAIDYLFLALAAATYAFAVQRTGVLPRWTAWLGWIAAAGAAGSVPAAFGGTGFYSQLGPATLVIGFVPGLAWNLGAAIAMIRLPRGPEVIP